MKSFARWWSEEGSAMRPMPAEDVEEFAKRIAMIAWSNGAYIFAKQPEPVASIYISQSGEREFDDWKCKLPIGRNLLYTTPPAARPQQEPFGYFRADAFGRTDCAETDENAKALYEYPFESRQWVGLTEGERNDLEDYCEMLIGKEAFDAIEAKLKERNT